VDTVATADTAGPTADVVGAAAAVDAGGGGAVGFPADSVAMAPPPGTWEADPPVGPAVTVAAPDLEVTGAVVCTLDAGVAETAGAASAPSAAPDDMGAVASALDAGAPAADGAGTEAPARVDGGRSGGVTGALDAGAAAAMTGAAGIVTGAAAATAGAAPADVELGIADVPANTDARAA